MNEIPEARTTGADGVMAAVSACPVLALDVA